MTSLRQFLDDHQEVLAKAPGYHKAHSGTCPDCPELTCPVCESAGKVPVTAIGSVHGDLTLEAPCKWVPCPACRPKTWEALWSH